MFEASLFYEWSSHVSEIELPIVCIIETLADPVSYIFGNVFKNHSMASGIFGCPIVKQRIVGWNEVFARLL